jgi:hypothetical protein
LFEQRKESSSPYINRFLSADTIVPNPTNPQSLNRYSYVTNNPLRYTDPTGHMRVQDGSQEDRFSQSVADKYVPKPKKKGKGGGGGGHPLPSPDSGDGGDVSDFLSDFAYGADIAGAALSDIEMIVADTIGALTIAEGCATVAGCLPAIGTAGFMDFAISSYSPLGVAENVAGGLALFATMGADFVSGTSYLRSDRKRITIGIGQDSVVSLVNTMAGQVPEANFDAWISHKQLEYDERRRSGELAGITMFEINIPRITIPPPFH